MVLLHEPSAMRELLVNAPAHVPHCKQQPYTHVGATGRQRDRHREEQVSAPGLEEVVDVQACVLSAVGEIVRNVKPDAALSPRSEIQHVKSVIQLCTCTNDSNTLADGLLAKEDIHVAHHLWVVMSYTMIDVSDIGHGSCTRSVTWEADVARRHACCEDDLVKLPDQVVRGHTCVEYDLHTREGTNSGKHRNENGKTER